MSKTYKYEELFQDIPDDPDNILMTIPPEICEEAGLKPGDVVNVKVENGSLFITKKSEEIN